MTDAAAAAALAGKLLCFALGTESNVCMNVCCVLSKLKVRAVYFCKNSRNFLENFHFGEFLKTLPISL